MPQWQGKSKGTVLGYQIFVFVCKHLGVYPAYFILRFVAFYYFLFSWNSSGHTYRYFRRRFKYGRVSSLIKLYQNYYVFGQTLLDKFIIMAGIPQRFTFHHDGSENLVKMMKNGKGGILISGHVGNWEAAGHLLRGINVHVNVVMYDGEHQRIKDYLGKQTGGSNFNIILIKNDMSHVYAIGDALLRNELICLHADRFMKGNKTAAVNFLGEPALFPVGPFLLAASFKAPVSMVYAFKETSQHYHFFSSELILRKEEEPKDKFIERMMNTFVMDLEQKVKNYPLQWFNYYNFWEK
jgi:predicted LPLAT superfamily acyltransferase